MRHQTIALCLVLSFSAVLCAAAAADDKTGLELLTEKGLKKVRPTFMLEEEVELGKMLREGAAKRKKVLEVQKTADAAELAVEQKKQLIMTYMQQRRQLRAQMQQVRDFDKANKMITAINELADRVNLMEKSDQHEKAAKAARGAAHQATEEYSEFLMKAERLYKNVNERYADLAADPKVSEAMAEVSKAEGIEYRLGPGRSFLSAGKRLEGLLQQVVSEKIDIRQGHGDLWFVRVMFNAKHAKEMSIDTGSSSIALPYALAKSMDMAPSSQAPEVQCQLADGTIIDCRLIIAKKVRVGPFTVENVQCTVFPEDCIHAEPLLGMSFLQHFNYKIDTDHGTLVMTRINTGSGKVTIEADQGEPEEAEVGTSQPHAEPNVEPAEPKVTIVPQGEPKVTVVPQGEPNVTIVPQGDSSDEMDDQIERLAKLLTSNQGDGVTVSVAGKPTEFSPSRSGPADRLKARLGEPDAVVDVPSPNPDDENAKWQVWTWRKLQLLVDDAGVVRYIRHGD